MTNFVQNISEALTMVDVASKAASIKRAEALTAKDTVRRNALAVVSDMTIGSADMTPEQFAQWLSSGSPPGYADFRPFIVGDHEYRKCIVKGVLVSSDANTPRIKRLEIDIDVPDVFDRGSVTTSGAGTVTVLFSRQFYTPPEVIPTLKSGTVIGTPIVSNITVSGFDLKLLDINNTNIVGLVGWQAKGY